MNATPLTITQAYNTLRMPFVAVTLPRRFRMAQITVEMYMPADLRASYDAADMQARQEILLAWARTLFAYTLVSAAKSFKARS